MNIQAQLQTIFRAALVEVAGGKLTDGQLAEMVEMVRPSQDPKFGDYQANAAMPLAKLLGRPPRDVATAIVERLGKSAEAGLRSAIRRKSPGRGSSICGCATIG